MQCLDLAGWGFVWRRERTLLSPNITVLFKPLNISKSLNEPLLQSIHNLLTQQGFGCIVVNRFSLCDSFLYDNYDRSVGGLIEFDPWDSNHYMSTQLILRFIEHMMQCFNVLYEPLSIDNFNFFDGKQTPLNIILISY